MPMLIINMGGEMVYILEQRLHAQNIAEDKAKRVLQDVIRTMYNSKFIAELFRSQATYSMQATRQIFDRLAHSSIMRLNESSMDKLFDLMAMGFKYQMLSCAYPQELLQVTLNHLFELRTKIFDSTSVRDVVDEVIAMTNSKYAAMGNSQYAGLKQALCRFFTDKKVKVSLFLQDAIQRSDGTIALSCKGTLPPGVDSPGKVSYFDKKGSVIGVDNFVFPETAGVVANDAGAQAGCRLGLNLYKKDKNEAAAAASSAAVRAAAAEAKAAPQKAKVDSVQAERMILQSGQAQQATRNLNLLADLVGNPPPADNFKLNLFPEISMPSSASGGAAADPVIMIDAGRDVAQTNSNLVGIMKEMRAEDSAEVAGDSDLLDLMDNVN